MDEKSFKSSENGKLNMCTPFTKEERVIGSKAT